MKKRYKLDWLSIVLPYSSFVSRRNDAAIFDIAGHHRDEFPQISDWLMSHRDIRSGGGNRIFNESMYSPSGGFRVFWNKNKPFTLIEISGIGVDNLYESKLIKRFVNLYGNYLSRIDLAIDFHTDVKVRDFHEDRDKSRFTSHSEITSDTGETCYVGSPSSDRLSRCYRYNAPHPRHELLRVEFVLRKANAKLFARLIQSYKLPELAAQLFAAFGYNHPITKECGSGEKLLAAPRTSNLGSTERWLFKQVLPAAKRIIDNGSDEIVDIFLTRMYDHLNEFRIRKEANNVRTHLLADPDENSS